jgi:hypothetical protein
MGMDVYGIAPTNEIGTYFRRSVWGWGPLADLVCYLAPAVTGRCKRWQSNGGDGLNARDSATLALILIAAIDDGTVAEIVTNRAAEFLTVDDVKEFADFLAACGGFKIC